MFFSFHWPIDSPVFLGAEVKPKGPKGVKKTKQTKKNFIVNLLYVKKTPTDVTCTGMFQFERNRKRNKNKLQKAPIELLKRPAEGGRRKYRLIIETVSVRIIKIKKNEITKQKQTLELQKKKVN